MVISGLPGGVYCAVKSWNDGTAMNSRMTTGPTVHKISISVLWVVREGTGFRFSLNLYMHQPRSAMTSKVMGTMNHSV